LLGIARMCGKRSFGLPYRIYNKNWDGCRDLWKEPIGWFSGTYMTKRIR